MRIFVSLILIVMTVGGRKSNHDQCILPPASTSKVDLSGMSREIVDDIVQSVANLQIVGYGPTERGDGSVGYFSLYVAEIHDTRNRLPRSIKISEAEMNLVVRNMAANGFFEIPEGTVSDRQNWRFGIYGASSSIKKYCTKQEFDAILNGINGSVRNVVLAQENPGMTKPRTPKECRHETVREMRRFREQQRADIPKQFDEHTWGVMDRSFKERQRQVLFLLISTDDKEAIDQAIKIYDLENIAERAWADKWLTNKSLPELAELIGVLGPCRPDIVEKINEQILISQRTQRENEVRIISPTPVDQMNRADLKNEAIQPEGWGERRHQAILRWSRIEPKEAIPWLVEQIDNNAVNINIRMVAARALALLGDERGLNWLHKATLNNIGLGGRPGAALLDAGEKGEQIYFKIVAEQERANPGREIPYGLGSAGEECSKDALFRNLALLLEIRGDAVSFTFRSAIERYALPAREISIAIDHLKKRNYADIYLCSSVRRSLIEHGPADSDARRVAGIWVDELLISQDDKQWELGAEIFVGAHIGTLDIAATTARHHLAKGNQIKLACRILEHAGKPEDAIILWEATHRSVKQGPMIWYAGPSDGWEAIIRLTNKISER